MRLEIQKNLISWVLYSISFNEVSILHRLDLFHKMSNNNEWVHVLLWGIKYQTHHFLKGGLKPNFRNFCGKEIFNSVFYNIFFSNVHEIGNCYYFRYLNLYIYYCWGQPNRLPWLDILLYTINVIQYFLAIQNKF